MTMEKSRMDRKAYHTITTACTVLAVLLTACTASTYGKFQAKEGMPKFIKVGETTRAEVFEKLGEPAVHRFVAGRETAVYSNSYEDFMVFYGTYSAQELVIRFENNVVADAKIEKTGSGWGCLMPPAPHYRTMDSSGE